MSHSLPDAALRGYLEGYYGRLLTWPERTVLLQTLQHLGLNAWLYAPKEDNAHRVHWRSPYSDEWREHFRRFTTDARAAGVHVLAGIAPGLDFDFNEMEGAGDFAILLGKCHQLMDDGASALCLLLDDIDDDFSRRAGPFNLEGEAHATLANRLGAALDADILVVPRIYARELAQEAPDYLHAFGSNLDERHALSVCGSDVVTQVVKLEDCRLPGDRHPARRVIVWDNLYANDYCPRRLFTGPWTGRESLTEVLLNPTGLLHTDQLQLELMVCHATEREALLLRHGVPPAFACIAGHLWHPVCNPVPGQSLAAGTRGQGADQLDKAGVAVGAIDAACLDGSEAESLPTYQEQLAALDTLLWRWKTPLSREWYPMLMGLRHDLLLASGQSPAIRVQKTYLPPLHPLLPNRDQGSTTSSAPVV